MREREEESIKFILDIRRRFVSLLFSHYTIITNAIESAILRCDQDDYIVANQMIFIPNDHFKLNHKQISRIFILLVEFFSGVWNQPSIRVLSICVLWLFAYCWFATINTVNLS